MKTQPLAFVLVSCICVLTVIAVTDSLVEAEPGVAPIVRAEAFELVDADGQVRSRLTIEESGQVVLRMLDETGNIRVKIGADADGSGLVLLNDSTEPGIQMLAQRDETVIRLTGTDGTAPLELHGE